jgi:hypothetical protein
LIVAAHTAGYNQGYGNQGYYQQGPGGYPQQGYYQQQV